MNHPEAKAFYEKLAPLHKKAYIEWSVTAKKEETKEKCLEQMIEKLDCVKDSFFHRGPELFRLF